MNGITQVRHVVVSRAVNVSSAAFSTIVTIATIGAVKPHFKLVGAISCQLCTLTEEYVLYVRVLTILCIVAVPR